MNPKIIVCYDDHPNEVVDKFSKALKEFGLFVADVTPENGETIEVVITKNKPKKEWGDK
jgi:hypothetical protein